jgi:hypothetical protein
VPLLDRDPADHGDAVRHLPGAPAFRERDAKLRFGGARRESGEDERAGRSEH